MFDYNLIKGVEPVTEITLTRFKDKISGTAKVTYRLGTKVYAISTVFYYAVDNMNSFNCIHGDVIEGTNIKISEEDYDNYWSPDFTIFGE